MNAPAVLPTAIDELWRWHGAHDLDRRAPPWLVERAINQHEAERAARTPLSLETAYATHLAESALDEIAAGMVSHAERCDANARLAPRLARIGHEADAEKVASCRTSGRFVQRESDARFIPFPDSKCRRPRVCPHCARDEAARLRRRYVKRLRALAHAHPGAPAAAVPLERKGEAPAFVSASRRRSARPGPPLQERPASSIEVVSERLRRGPCLGHAALLEAGLL